MVWFLMAVPVGFGLMMFRLLQSLRRDVADIMAGRPVFEGLRLFD
jgi:TRAP-type C4-dicarboxylate transport system permease small subunit